MEEIKKELREIVSTSARRLTAEQRERVREIATELGVKLPTKSGCNSCWIDTAVLCYEEARKRTAETDAGIGGRKYVLKPNVRVIFGEIRVNAETLTDELAEQIIKRGFDRDFFEKCE